MTQKELSQLYYLNREIEMDRRRLRELEAKAAPGARRLTGMPRAGGVSDRVGDCAAELADLRDLIEARRRECVRERERLERYIDAIPDSITRQIFRLRFVNGLGYEQVAFALGGGNTFEGVRKRVYRYLRKN